MDNNETLSDCSESSKNSDLSTTTLSDLSAYEGEFLELKHAITPGRHNRKNVIFTKQHDNIKLNQKTTLSYNEKIEKLLKQNLQLEDSLKSANDHIQRLINIYKSQERGNISSLEEKNLVLEKHNHNLNLEISRLSSQLIQCNYKRVEIENDYKNLKTEVNELKLETSAQEKSIIKLKDKILEPHCELQTISHNNVKFIHTIDSLSNELHQVRKSENWYKNELRKLQSERVKLKKEIDEKHKISLSQAESMGQLNWEINKWKWKYDELYLQMLKEKSKMNDNNENNCEKDIQSIVTSYENFIHELTNEIANIKLSFKYQQNSFDELTKQNLEITRKYLLLENDLQEKKNLIEKLESEGNECKKDLIMGLSREEEYKANILHLTNTNTNLKTELGMKIQEKENIEETVKTIKRQFQIFKSKYEEIKAELNVKNKEILELQLQKQESYFLNERQKFEIKNKEKEIVTTEKNLDLPKKIDQLKNDAMIKTSNNLKKLVTNNCENPDYILLEHICKLCKVDNYSVFLQSHFNKDKN